VIKQIETASGIVNIDDDLKYLLYLLVLSNCQISQEQLFKAFKSLKLNSEINWKQGFESGLATLDLLGLIDIEIGMVELELEHQFSVAAVLDPKSKQLVEAVKHIHDEISKHSYLPLEIVHAQLRLAFYANDLKSFKEYESKINDTSRQEGTAVDWDLCFVHSIVEELSADHLPWYRSLDPYLQEILTAHALRQFLGFGLRVTLVDEICNQTIDKIPEKQHVDYLMAQLYHGRLDLVKQSLAQYQLHQLTDEHMYLFATYNLLIDNVDQAYNDFQLGLSLARSRAKDRAAIIPRAPFSLFYALTLLKQSPRKHYPTILNTFKKSNSKQISDLYKSIKLMADLAVGNNLSVAESFHSLKAYLDPIESLVGQIVLAVIQLSFYYYNEANAIDALSHMHELIESESANTCELIKKLYTDIRKATIDPNVNNTDFEIKLDFTKLFDKQFEWQRKLDTLQSLFKPKESSGQELKVGTKRFAWQFSPSLLRVTLIEQTLMKNGRWSSGKARNPEYEQYELMHYATHATKQDIEAISAYASSSPIRQNLGLNTKEAAIYSLVGHPNIYNIESHNQPCNFHKANVKLLVHETADHQVLIKLSHQAAYPKLFVEETEKNNYRIVHFNRSSVELCQTLGPNGITVPALAKEQVLSILKQANSLIEIETELDYEDLPSVEADSRPHLSRVSAIGVL
jgi:hypothetical protein